MIWMPKADAGVPRRTGGHACCSLLRCVLWNAGGYVRCRAPAIPRNFWWMEQHTNKRTHTGALHGALGQGHRTSRGLAHGLIGTATEPKGRGINHLPHQSQSRSLRALKHSRP